MRVQLKPHGEAVKATPRRYEPAKRDWLSKCIAALVFFGFVYQNIQAVWASPAMAVSAQEGLLPSGKRLLGGERAGGGVPGSHAQP
ncbi:unnamed protein product [Hapterophycus canaliculatus]